jgi:uncharacterized YkwD family protein/spore coat assembly protein SafA
MFKKLVAISLASLCFMAIYHPKPTDAQENNIHVVQSGESMWKISVKYQIGLSEIINANASLVKNPSLIYPGQKLNVPNIDNVKNVETEVLALVNQERQKAGLRPLEMDWELQRVARMKSQDMAQKNYFSHQSPTYGSPFDMMKQFGIKFSTAGENIASGQRTPQEVMASWMKSPGHRANILKPEYTHLGVGYYRGGSYGHMWTQMFIAK